MKIDVLISLSAAACCSLLWAIPCHAFTVYRSDASAVAVRNGTSEPQQQSSTSLFMGKRKNKPSMKERKARRAAKRKYISVDTPPSTVDNKTPPPKPSEALIASQKEAAAKNAAPAKETATTPGLDASEKITDPGTAQEKAKQLLQAQRESVETLTMVRERVESLPVDEVQSSLSEQGYHVVDKFLNDAAVIEKLHAEAKALLPSMELDVSNIGSGEYTTGIKGGEEQYAMCSRTVEFVVSVTKHAGGHLKVPNVNNGASMALLRSFDRKALKASLKLLTGDQDEESLYAASSSKPFEVVATEDNDQRRLSLFYYIVPDTWDEECGGGVTFRTSKDERVSAVSDRLVIFNSDTAKFQKEMWRGNDVEDNQIGSRLELHLVKN